MATQKGETESFIAARLGGIDKLKAALASGEVEEVHDQSSGKTFYKRFEIEAGRKVGTVNSSKVGGSQKITRMMADEAAKAIEALTWELASTPSTRASFEQGLCPKEWLDQVKKAIAAVGKCSS